MTIIMVALTFLKTFEAILKDEPNDEEIDAQSETYYRKWVFSWSFLMFVLLTQLDLFMHLSHVYSSNH